MLIDDSNGLLLFLFSHTPPPLSCSLARQSQDSICTELAAGNRVNNCPANGELAASLPFTTDCSLARKQEDVVKVSHPVSVRPPIAREDPGALPPFNTPHMPHSPCTVNSHTTTYNPHATTHTHTHTHTHTRTQTPTHTHTALGRLARDFKVASRATRRSAAAVPVKPLGGVAGAVAKQRRFGANLPRRQAPRWGGGVGSRRRKSLRRGPPFASEAGRGGPQTRRGAGLRVPRALRGLGLSVRHRWRTDVSLGAARRAWGIPLAGGASPLPRVKYPGHTCRYEHRYT